MKFWLVVLVTLMTLQSGSVIAGPWRDLRMAQGNPDRADRNGAQRQRDSGRNERSERQERPQRLSDDERRDLHRDLDKARREIYKPRPSR